MIYAFRAGSRGPVKIGFSTNPVKRVASLKTSCPAGVKPLGVMEGTLADEAALFRRLAEHRLHGEWFKPHREVLEVVKNMDAFPPLPERRKAKPKPSRVPAPRKQRETTSERIDKAKPAFLVVDKFGGLTRFCQLTGFSLSTVHSWQVRGIIPNRTHEASGLSYHGYIFKVAAENGVGLVAENFIEQLEPVVG